MRVGRTWHTTREAANAFFATRKQPQPQARPAPSASAVRAAKELESLGM